MFGGAYLTWKGEDWEYTVALTTGMPHQFYYDNHGEVPWGLIETLRLEEPGLLDTFNVNEGLVKSSLEYSTPQKLLDGQILFAEAMSWLDTGLRVETLPRVACQGKGVDFNPEYLFRYLGSKSNKTTRNINPEYLFRYLGSKLRLPGCSPKKPPACQNVRVRRSTIRSRGRMSTLYLMLLAIDQC